MHFPLHHRLPQIWGAACAVSLLAFTFQYPVAMASDDESTGESTLEMTDDTVGEPTKRLPVDEEGRVVSFERDVAPILRAKCLECHGPDEAKNDFRVDDPDLVFDYVIAEDALSSSLFVDYLTTEDDDMMMPPRSHRGPLLPSELAIIRLWIDEGAHWPEDAVVGESAAALVPVDEMLGENRGLASRIWSFQGFLHPATVHFPIALLVVGALFVVLGWRWPAVGTQIPLACLWIGAGSAVVASVMGWSFSVEKGYGSWSRFDFDAEIFWHRWTAMVVTVLASFFAIVAIFAVRNRSARLTATWKSGLLLVAVLVGMVGHQGGELIYGADFYPKAIHILLGTPVEPGVSASDVSISDRTAGDDSASGGDNASGVPPEIETDDDLSAT